MQVSNPKTENWKFRQIIGDDNSWDEYVYEDGINALAFSQNGKYFSIGDNDGRLIVFEYKEPRKNKFYYLYLTEF